VKIQTAIFYTAGLLFVLSLLAPVGASAEKIRPVGGYFISPQLPAGIKKIPAGGGAPVVIGRKISAGGGAPNKK